MQNRIFPQVAKKMGHNPLPSFLGQKSANPIESKGFILTRPNPGIHLHTIAGSKQKGLIDPLNGQNPTKHRHFFVVCPCQTFSNIHGGSVMTEADEEHGGPWDASITPIFVAFLHAPIPGHASKEPGKRTVFEAISRVKRQR
jgi:hypothetical protein